MQAAFIHLPRIPPGKCSILWIEAMHALNHSVTLQTKSRPKSWEESIWLVKFQYIRGYSPVGVLRRQGTQQSLVCSCCWCIYSSSKHSWLDKPKWIKVKFTYAGSQQTTCSKLRRLLMLPPTVLHGEGNWHAQARPYLHLLSLKCHKFYYHFTEKPDLGYQVW